jgi:hypothetical protein
VSAPKGSNAVDRIAGVLRADSTDPTFIGSGENLAGSESSIFEQPILTVFAPSARPADATVEKLRRRGKSSEGSKHS